MAYAAAVTITTLGGSDYHVQIEETDAATASEKAITGLPVKGRVLRHTCALTAGTGTTVDPSLTNTSAGTGAAVVLENDSASATTDTVSDPGIPYYDADGTLYLKSGVDAGADNVITTIVLIRGGW